MPSRTTSTAVAASSRSQRTGSVRCSAAAEPSKRRTLAGLLSVGFISIANPGVALAKSRKEKLAPPKSEYELMMDRLKEEGKGPQDGQLQQKFEQVKPACIEYGGEVSSNYASGTSRYYDCKPSDERTK